MRSFHAFLIRSIKPSWRVSMPTSTVFASFLLLIKAISSCVISPSESVVIVGDHFSFSCSARSNNQREGSISIIKLGSDTASGTDIFRPPAHSSTGRIIKHQYLADGYFLSQLDDSHGKVTIQINETQLKHGGEYFCSCVESTSKLGTANFTVLDKLSFVRNGDENLTPGTLVDLNCSVSFNGSTSSAFIDLTISDANSTQVSTKRNLSLINNVTGHHVILSKVVCDPKEEQRFTCEVKVWKKSSIEGSPLHLKTFNRSLNFWDQQTTTTSYSTSAAYQTSGSTVAVVVIVVLLVVGAAAFIAIFMYKRYNKRRIANGTISALSVEQRISADDQDIQHKDADLSIEHPSQMMPPQNSDSMSTASETTAHTASSAVGVTAVSCV